MPEKTRGEESATKPAGDWRITVALFVIAGVILGAAMWQFVFRAERVSPPSVRQAGVGDASNSGGKPASGESDADRAVRDVYVLMEKNLSVAQDKAGMTDKVVQGVRRTLLESTRDLGRQTMDKFPSAVIIRPVMARVLLEMDDVGAADRIVAGLQKKSPTDVAAMCLGGMIFRRRGQSGWQEAMRQAADAPSAPSWVLREYVLALESDGQGATAGRYVDRAIEAGRKEGKLSAKDVVLLVASGQGLLESGQAGKAVSVLSEAVELSPLNFVASLLLLRAYRLDGKLNLAEDAWRRAYESFSDVDQQADLIMEQGEQLLARGMWKFAGDAFADAAEFTSHRPDASLKAAEAYYRASDARSARKWIVEAADANPGDKRVADLDRLIEKMPTSMPASSMPTSSAGPVVGVRAE